jgi:hypothetical protein
MGILSEVDKVRRIWRLAYGMEERGSVPIVVEDVFLLSKPFFFLGCHARPRIPYLPVVLSAGNFPSEVEVNSKSPYSAVAEN